MSTCSRREFLTGAAAVSAGAIISQPAVFGEPQTTETPDDVPPPDYKIQNGRVKQSVQAWCYENTSDAELIDACAKMGLHAMEGISRKHYPKIKSAGMDIGIVGSHGFKDGPVHRDNHDMCTSKLREAIDVAVKYDAENVITFTGIAEEMPREKGAQNCVDCWKEVIGYAEEQGITLCLEHLNSRGEPPMRGHPGYFGDDVDFCVDLINRVGSEHMKLLFDIYHVQIMNGDVIRRIEEYQDVIGHYHTAGVPGRVELDEHQELNYPPIIKTILETDFDGFVAQEFIPTWKDELASLRHGVRVCDR